MGWVLKPSAHNSINVLSSKFTSNSISIELSYVRVDQPIMDSYQLQYTQHGLVTVTLHITRFMNNRVMWKTNHHCGHSILVLRPYAKNNYNCSGYQFGEPEVLRTSRETMASLTTKATHFFKIIMPGTLEEGKLVSILYFLFFFVSENHMFNIDCRPLYLLYL